MATTMKKDLMKKQNTLVLEIGRNSLNTMKITFKVPQILTDFWKSKSLEVRQSQYWDNLKFYYAPSITGSQEYKDLLDQFDLFDNFGNVVFMFEDGRFKMNIAFLRAVDGKGEFTSSIGFVMPEKEIIRIVRNVKGFIKRFYREFCENYKVRLIIDFE